MLHRRYGYILDILVENDIGVQNKMIVDCACGDGTGSRHLEGAGAFVTAIDIAEDKIKECSDYGIEDARQGDIRKLDLPDHYCDLFCCSETLEHLVTADCITAASEIQRVTRPGGYICITVPGTKQSLKNSLHKTWVKADDLIAWFDQCEVVFTGRYIKNKNLPRRFNLSMILKLESVKLCLPPYWVEGSV